MHLPYGTDVEATPPTPETIVGATHGYFRNGDTLVNGKGTVVPGDFLNAVAVELLNLATMKGASADATRAVNDQAKVALEAIKVLESSANPITVATNTTWIRAIIASTLAKAEGARAAVIAASGITVNDCLGDDALLAACYNSTITAAADRAAMLGCTAGSVSGTNALAAGATGPDVGGTNAASVATDGGHVDGTQAFAGGCEDTDVSGTNNAALACLDTTVDSVGEAAAIACGSCEVDGGASLLVGSSNARLSTDFALALGFSGVPLSGSLDENLTIRFEGQTGDGYFDGAADVASADYAELFENLKPGALPVASLVGRVGARVRAAEPGDAVLGVVSAAPAVVGNSSSLGWRGKFELDEWGRRLRAPVDCVRWPALHEDRIAWRARPFRPGYDGPYAAVVGQGLPDDAQLEVRELVRDTEPATLAEKVLGKVGLFARRKRVRVVWASWPKRMAVKAYDGPVADAGSIPTTVEVHRYRVKVRKAYSGPVATAPLEELPEDAERFTTDAPVVTEGYDPTREYVPRRKRPEEWTVVGLVGQVPVRVAEGVQVGDLLVPGNVPGVAVAGEPSRRDRLVEVLEVREGFDAERGYGIAWCLVG